MRVLCVTLLATLLLALPGCDRGKACEDNLNCAFDEVCRRGRCEQRACQSSADCPIQQYCDDQLGTCTLGCQLDRDCLPDEFCDLGECAARGCRDTNLDCAIGEYCNTITGECFAAGGPFCQPCQNANDCGGGANFCFTMGGWGPYCGVDCSNGQECPRGYDCVGIVDPGGNVIGRNCATPCYLLEP